MERDMIIEKKEVIFVDAFELESYINEYFVDIPYDIVNSNGMEEGMQYLCYINGEPSEEEYRLLEEFRNLSKENGVYENMPVSVIMNEMAKNEVIEKGLYIIETNF